MSTSLIDTLIEKAKKYNKRVALPECESEKTLLAARRLIDGQIAIPVLVNNPAVIQETASLCNISLEGMEIADITDSALCETLLADYMKYNQIFSEKAIRRKMKNPMNFAMMLEAAGQVDCTFCGHTNTTGDVLMAAQSFIGLKEGIDVPSITALVEIPGFEGPEGNCLIFADCGLNPEPTPAELASIAISAADHASALMEWEPRVAFLSFSTKGSGSADSIDRITEAVHIAQETRPDLKIDGELQLDAALIPAVAEKKIGAGTPVAGSANVLIFPELNAANLMIKSVQIFAKGNGYGHTLSGFRYPVADSSRGASLDEIIGDIAMLILAAS